MVEGRWLRQEGQAKRSYLPVSSLSAAFSSLVDLPASATAVSLGSLAVVASSLEGSALVTAGASLADGAVGGVAATADATGFSSDMFAVGSGLVAT